VKSPSGVSLMEKSHSPAGVTTGLEDAAVDAVLVEEQDAISKRTKLDSSNFFIAGLVNYSAKLRQLPK
jgi:hypothetical protein